MNGLFLTLFALIASLQVRFDPATTGLDAERATRPVLQLSQDMIGNGQVLEISFDELSHTLHNYTYTLRHLNADGTPDNLASTDYLRGFTTADITDYEYSFNTQQLYTHYRFTFPSEDMQPTLSGNYLLLIYEDARVEEPVAQVPIRIVEPLTPIHATVRYDTQKGLSTAYQQVDVEVGTSALNVISPEQVTLIVQQNNRTDNQVVIHRPTYVESGRLRYINQPSLIFEGGNEYRHFDISSEYIKGYNVDQIEYVQGDEPSRGDCGYMAYLFPSELRNNGYSYQPDGNGIYVIHKERVTDPDTEADYMWVNFLLPMDYIWPNGAIYILGDAWGNRKDATTRMHYNATLNAYHWRSYLKQGGYEWIYSSGVEGNYWQTHNQYRIWVYFRGTGDRYDRLVGVQDIEN